MKIINRTLLSTILVFFPLLSFAYILNITNTTPTSFQTDISSDCMVVSPSSFLQNQGTIPIKLTFYNPDRGVADLVSYPQGFWGGWIFLISLTQHREKMPPPWVCTAIRDVKSPWQGYYCYSIPDVSHPTYSITVTQPTNESQTITINPV